MKLNHRADTKSLYIEFTEPPSIQSPGDFKGIAVGYGADGRIAVMAIDDAGNKGCAGKPKPESSFHRPGHPRSL